MKTKAIVPALLLLFSALFQTACEDVLGVKGKGDKITETRDVDNFHALEISANGAIAAPWDSFLLLRSTKTLHVRVQRHCENAAKIADFLAEQKQIERVVYPGRTDHPQHEIAKKQMRGGYGGMITATFKGGLPAARTFLERVHLFSLAESLGGVESLIVHTAAMWSGTMNEAQMKAAGIPPNFVRFSVGLEHPDDLKRDLANALAQSETAR